MLVRGDVSSIAFSPDGKKLAAGGGSKVAVVDLATGQTMSQVRGLSDVASLAFSPKGNLVAIGEYGGSFVLWNPGNGHSTRITAPGRDGYSWPLLLAPLGIWILTAWYLWSRRKNARGCL
jgi:WD40 repeat protein